MRDKDQGICANACCLCKRHPSNASCKASVRMRTWDWPAAQGGVAEAASTASTTTASASASASSLHTDTSHDLCLPRRFSHKFLELRLPSQRYQPELIHGPLQLSKTQNNSSRSGAVQYGK